MSYWYVEWREKKLPNNQGILKAERPEKPHALTILKNSQFNNKEERDNIRFLVREHRKQLIQPYPEFVNTIAPIGYIGNYITNDLLSLIDKICTTDVDLILESINQNSNWQTVIGYNYHENQFRNKEMFRSDVHHVIKSYNIDSEQINGIAISALIKQLRCRNWCNLNDKHAVINACREVGFLVEEFRLKGRSFSLVYDPNFETATTETISLPFSYGIVPNLNEQ